MKKKKTRRRIILFGKIQISRIIKKEKLKTSRLKFEYNVRKGRIRFLEQNLLDMIQKPALTKNLMGGQNVPNQMYQLFPL